MKKILSLTLCILMLFSVVGCGEGDGDAANVDFVSIIEEMKKTDTQMPETATTTEASDNAETIFGMLAEGFDYSKVEKFIYCYSATGSPEEIAIILVKDNAGVGDLMNAIQAHIDARKSMFQAYSPEEAKVVEQAVLMNQDRYVFMGIGSTSDMMQDIFSSTLAEETVSPEPTVEVPRKIEAPGFEKTVQQAERIEKGEHYEHGEDGYFLLADQGIKTNLKAQHAGTCWAHAASTSMESNYLMRTGEEIVVDPYEIVNVVYSDDKKEGIFVENAGKMDSGGNTWFVTETLSNGFGEYFLTKSICCEGLSIEKVQDAIRENGAMSMGMSDGLDGRGYFDGYLTQYDSEDLNNHSVAVVGWDDHFPREYFKELPSRDGAWIVQDSQINADYCYMSRDAEITDSCIFELSKDYKDIMYYEFGCYDAVETGDSTTIANVFHKEGSLAAVGVYVPEHGESVQIAVYDEKTGEKLAEEEETFDIKGYYAVPLSEPVPVKDYRIEACFGGPAPVEGQSWDEGLSVYRASSEEGQSFVKVGEKWLDLAKKSTKKALGIKFTPNNACIKGLYK